MLVEFPARFVKRLTGATAGRCWAHDRFDLNFGSAPVVSRHATAHVTLGDNTDKLEVFSILYHGRAAAA